VFWRWKKKRREPKPDPITVHVSAGLLWEEAAAFAEQIAGVAQVEGHPDAASWVRSLASLYRARAAADRRELRPESEIVTPVQNVPRWLTFGDDDTDPDA
jgi:hypothetical protein